MTAAARRLAAFVDRWHWLLLALIAPLLLFPSPRRSLALALIPTLWVTAWVSRRELLPHTPLNGALGLLGAMVVVSTYATSDIAVSLPKLCGVVLGIGVFHAVVREGQRPFGW